MNAYKERIYETSVHILCTIILTGVNVGSDMVISLYMVHLSSTAWMVACPFSETVLICHQWQAVVRFLKFRRTLNVEFNVWISIVNNRYWTLPVECILFI